MEKLLFRRQLAPRVLYRATARAIRPSLASPVSFTARRTKADSSTSADNISKPQGQDQAPQSIKEAPYYQNYMIIAGTVALSALGYYYYALSSRRHEKTPAQVSTAAGAVSPKKSSDDWKSANSVKAAGAGKSSGNESSSSPPIANDSEKSGETSASHNDESTGLFKVTAEHKSKDEYQQVYNSIAKKIAEEDEYDDGVGYGPILVRLAWHASGSHDRNDKSGHHGGNFGGTMVHKYEAKDPGNSGLEVAREFLRSIQEKYGWISRGDLFSLAGVAAIQEMAGPKIEWRPGRQNLGEPEQPPHGRLPDASQGATHVREVFDRLAGFTDEETAALIGVGHTIGKCHKDRLGYDGPWTFSPNMVTNQFFDLLVNEEWQIKKWDGPVQFEDKKTQSLMMLPTDFALVFDPKFKKISEEFAKDSDKLLNVFASAFARLLELGMEFPKDQERWKFKTLEEQGEE